MSYEGEMLRRYSMPSKLEVEQALLKTLFNNNGSIKEFSSDENIVNELADYFSLNQEQKSAVLERIYRKENRIVKSPLWHRLLFRAADLLAKEKLITRPSTTFLLNNKKEWMLTEEGYDKALELLNIPISEKEILLVKSYEVEKIVKKIKERERPLEYNPFEKSKKTYTISKETKLRNRSFRQAIIEVYNCSCAICGLKLPSPDNLQWEVEAAHIVPHKYNGKDDVWNGLALCHLHHWAFDAGWFSLQDDFRIIVSNKITSLPEHYGKFHSLSFMNKLTDKSLAITLPVSINNHPHISAIKWHRENILYK
jgi:hypothetical protein